MFDTAALGIRHLGTQALGSLDDGIDVYEIVDDGIDGQAGQTVDLEFAGYVAAMGDDCVDRDAEMGGYLLVAHALDQRNNDFFFAFRERLGAVFAFLEDHVADVACHVSVLDQSLQAAYGGNKDVILDHRMLG